MSIPRGMMTHNSLAEAAMAHRASLDRTWLPCDEVFDDEDEDDDSDDWTQDYGDPEECRVFCSFCRTDIREAEKMVSGPAVNICDVCVRNIYGFMFQGRALNPK